MKRIPIVFFALFIFKTSIAQQLNVPKGKQFELISHKVQTGANQQDESYTYSFRSLGKDKTGNNIFEVKTVKVLIKDPQNKMRTLINTDSLRLTSLNQTTFFVPLALLNRPLIATVSPKGKLISLTGMSEALDQALEKWNINPETAQMLQNNVKGGFYNDEIQNMFLELPDKKIAIASEWQVPDQGLKFKVTGAKGATMTIHSKKHSDSLKIDRNYTYNSATGLIQNSVFNESKEFRTADGKTSTSNFKSTIKQLPVTQRKAPDTEWLDMAIKFGYWSNALKKGAEYDSLKVFNYFKENDAKFSTDAHYVSTKLHIIQSFRGDRSYKMYDSILVNTPTKYLEGEFSHLHNQIGSVLDKKGEAAAYEVSKYLYKSTSFDSWLQHSLSQAFIVYDDDERSKQRREKSFRLMELFNANKDSVYQQKTKGLYLWADAKRDKNNIPKIVDAADQLSKMNDAYMKEGNGGRYSLLLYKMLIEANKQPEAEALLASTIPKLEKYTADTLYKGRYAVKNMLAAAYYFKYEAAVAKGATDAVQYLAKASQYSPAEAKEKAYESFYDRVFLNTKESYQPEFLDKLLAGGDEQQALKVFVASVNAQPENLEKMQEVYEKGFPGKKFKDFFTQNIVSSWESAPEFKLKGVDGKEHNLSDFKNKWLVLDFWGTWCGPCKAEMPEVNKFNDELIGGKHSGINFLSIACYDEDKKVQQYLTDNKFGIPVAMSDGKVQTAFKVRGYPTKVIISPEGKMIMIDFGKDWKSTVKRFNNIYSSNL